MSGSTPEGVFELDAVVIGGCGHVGLPLAIALASRGARVGIYDVSQAAVETVNAGLPFAEAGLGVELDVAFCPERIAEGKAMTELFELPQIISARTARGVEI